MDVQRQKLPRHVAIIMDGNGRWARRQGLPRLEGHIAGIESVREIVTMTTELQIPYLTLYAFSKENWTRPKKEVESLLTLLAIYLEKELPLMMKNGVRFNAIGAIGDLPDQLQQQLGGVMEKTAANAALLLNMALSYGGRQEILRAARLASEAIARGEITDINEENFGRYLYTANMPDPDLLIRTSGEMRLSNFLLWQTAYTELYVTDTLWPDFRREAYGSALKDYTVRKRRFGSLKEV